MDKKLWRFLKFSFMLGIKSLPRLLIAPVVGAFRGAASERERIDAQISAYIEREFGEGPASGGR